MKRNAYYQNLSKSSEPNGCEFVSIPHIPNLCNPLEGEFLEVVNLAAALGRLVYAFYVADLSVSSRSS